MPKSSDVNPSGNLYFRPMAPMQLWRVEIVLQRWMGRNEVFTCRLTIRIIQIVLLSKAQINKSKNGKSHTCWLSLADLHDGPIVNMMQILNCKNRVHLFNLDKEDPFSILFSYSTETNPLQMWYDYYRSIGTCSGWKLLCNPIKYPPKLNNGVQVVLIIHWYETKILQMAVLSPCAMLSEA